MAIHAYYHVTPSGAGAKDGTTWATAFGEPEFETFMEGTVVAGDVIFIKEGTYTLDSEFSSSARAGTLSAPIALIGVKSTCTNEGAAVAYSDWARLSANRPYFDCDTNAITFGNYYVIRNISFRVAKLSTNGVVTGGYCIAENCKINSDGTNTYYAAEFGTQSMIINCEITGTGSGITTGSATKVLFCYFHDLYNGIDDGDRQGIFAGGAGSMIEFNILNNILIGIKVSGNDHIFLNNTFYNCKKALFMGTAYRSCIVNNAVDSCTVSGISSTTQRDSNFFWKNHGDDARNVDMWVNEDTTTIFQDYEVSTGDPLFTTPAIGVFSLTVGSPALDAGLSISLGV
jgi:hypothetical protein